MVERRVEEDNVRRATEVLDQPDLSRVQADHDQLPFVTGAEELSRARIEIEAMGSLGGNLEGVPNSRRLLRVDSRDEWRIRDIHVESGRKFLMHRPPRAPRKDHGPGHGPLVDIDQRNGRRVPYIGVADIGHEQDPTREVESEPIRTDAYG